MQSPCKKLIGLIAIFLTSTLGSTSISWGQLAKRKTELVFSFPKEKTYHVYHNDQDNSLDLTISQTHPDELTALDHYDESIIHRVIIKQIDQHNTLIRLFLKDRRLKATITHFTHPFRIIVDIYDRYYQTPKDPVTGLPLVYGESDNNQIATTEATEHQDNSQLVHQAPTQDLNHDKESSQDAPRLKLMQPQPNPVHSANELAAEIEKIQPGVGAQWQDMPIYIYRIQTAGHEHNQNPNSYHKSQARRAMSSSEAMAEYASKLFDFGHENRALFAYQQVLYKNSRLFSQKAIHLWKLAEIHFGQGNFTLADGYFQAMVDQHPSHPLTRFARLRRLDIRAIAATKQSKRSEFKSLFDEVTRLPSYKDPEYEAQRAIRKAYWRAFSSLDDLSRLSDPGFLPALEGTEQQALHGYLSQIQSPKTAFLAASLVLNDMLDNKNPWSPETGQFATEYLKRFSGKTTEPIRSILKEKLISKINSTLRDKISKGLLVEAIEDYESLSNILQVVKNDATIAWLLGEAYRRLGHDEKAIKFYQIAAQNSTSAFDRFKALFWLSQTAATTREALKETGREANRVSYLGELIRKSDQQMAKAWDELSSDKRNNILLTMKSDLEQSLNGPALLATPPKILLESWTAALSTQQTTETSASSELTQTYKPSANTVVILTKLAQRFAQLGLVAEKQKALAALRYMTPKDFNHDANATKLWANELINLADELRQNNNYLEAGRLYAFTGEHSEGLEKQSEALYKGGLLLFRSGRRDEAIKAFKRCSENKQDLYYANLCMKRLEIINNN